MIVILSWLYNSGPCSNEDFTLNFSSIIVSSVSRRKVENLNDFSPDEDA